MNNGYQNFNGCGADKEGWKIFNTFFYSNLQSKHFRPLATNSLIGATLHRLSDQIRCIGAIQFFFTTFTI